VCWRYGRKILKGRWRVLAWVRADADEVPKNQVGVFVEKILKGARVFLAHAPALKPPGWGGFYVIPANI